MYRSFDLRSGFKELMEMFSGELRQMQSLSSLSALFHSNSHSEKGFMLPSGTLEF